jgi:hypothetical protein
MKIDLKNFKKLSSDKNSTTFQHRDGHTLKVAHKGLSPNTLKDMMALGGEAGVHPYANEDSPRGESKAGEQARLASGAASKAEKSKYTDKAKEEHYKVYGQMKAQKSPSLMAQGGQTQQPQQPQQPPPQPTTQEPQNPSIDPEKAKQVEQGFKQATGFADGTPDAPVGEAPTADAGAAASDAAVPTQQMSFENKPLTLKAESDPMQAQLIQPSGPDATKQFLDNEAAKQENDLALGHIKPETYQQWFAKKDTVAKIGTIFGLLLGGAGAGLTHGPNQAFQMMDNEIKRDFEGQQKSSENAQNFYKLTQQNPYIQAQARKLGADTKAVNQAVALTATRQATFKALSNRVMGMPEGPMKEAAKQQLYQAYQGMQKDIADSNDAFSAQAFTTGAGGNQPQGQTPQQGQQPSPEPQDMPLLNQGSADKFKTLQFNPAAKEDYGMVRDQYNNAELMQEGRDKVKSLMNRMRDEATLSSYLQGKIDPRTWAELGGALGTGLGGALGSGAGGLGAIPGAGLGGSGGAALGAGLAGLSKQGLKALANQKGLEYENDKNTLLKLLGTYLHGANLNTEQIGEYAKNAVPISKHIEGEKAFKNKLSNIDDLFIANTPKGLLQKYNMTDFKGK